MTMLARAYRRMWRRVGPDGRGSSIWESIGGWWGLAESGDGLGSVNNYYRPDEASAYLRPDGSSYYIRP